MVSAQHLEGFLRRHPVVGLDSNLLIYLIEEHPEYHRLTEKVFGSIEAGRNTGVCSTLSLLEVLVQPYRESNDELVDQFYALLTTYPHIRWIDLSIGIADLGAQLRAKYQLKTPDAILAATSIEAGATGFIGNDSQLKRISELDILILSGD
ncbi:MAG: type II toxin-antitoxin system VapC family toxin [Candidatus Methylomirabilis oxygeniifera]|uniref:Similar to tr/Q3M7V5/Q3M7V5_ANAVT PilT protein-like n=1 Tax=Methylomirabilis oxygeniifera TaxID=671143 RepID=D5MIR2_METO1|nr:MAG: type II toxin-antitoxin system VapC family toxin [Candidatus Methylomirabilis oxyfera]CBE69419.1 Similar to tr/Q3M7V5/Q3M7V5_ANAVT PilT protein-like [Candidatus Methylomirabilis oxyfera]